MKKLFILFCLASAMAFASCNREELTPDETSPSLKGKTVLTLTSGETKTTMGELSGTERPVYWANGDQVNVNGVVSDPLADLPANSRSAEFIVNSVISPPFKAIYPASIWKDALTVTLPAVAKSGVLPLYGEGDASSITVTPLTAVLKLAIKKSSGENPDTDKIVKVQVSTENTKISGDFDFSTGSLLPGTIDSDTDKTVSITDAFNLSETAKELFIPVPAGTYNFKVKITDIQGHFMEISTTSAKTFAAGEIKAFPEIEFLPSGTQIDVVITNAEELIQFATDWNAGNWRTVVARVANDITFDATTSAAFNETGGIGLKEGYGDAEDHYFNGTFDGNGKTISGLAATVPLFKAIGSDGTVKDLTVATSCSFVFTQSNTAEANFGAVVDYLKGVLDHVIVKANVSLAPVANVSQLTTLGGICGRATVGTLNACSFDGNLSVPSGFTTTNKVVVGGLVGSLTNTGSVSDSYLNGTVLTEAQVTSTDKTNPYLIMGGIVGLTSGGGSISNCETTDHPAVNGYWGADGTTALPGTIVLNTALSYHNAIGGIVGESTKGKVSTCKNAATISITVLSTKDAAARYIRTGGIAGFSRSGASVSDCVNNAKIEHRSNPRLQALGGIVGINGGDMSGCTNNGALSIATSSLKPYSGRLDYLGGVIGENSSANVSDVHNTAKIEISRVEGTDGIDVRLGGVIGSTSGALDGGSTKNITNSGQVYYSATNEKLPSKTTLGYRIGGIVGYSSAAVSNVVNDGIVQIGASTTGTMSNVTIGGIAGIGIDAPLSGCVNNGNVFLGKSTTSGNAFTAANQPVRMGGIVGELSGASSIATCRNEGLVYLNATNNIDDVADSTFFEGGIAGMIRGSDSIRIPVTDCSWTYSTVAVGARRGTCGGVTGYAEYADISDCDVTVNYTKYNHYTGGIAGWLSNATLTNCKFHGTKIDANQGIGIGGIVARLRDGSVVDGCYSSATTLAGKPNTSPALGGIAAVSEVGTTIKNCHYSAAFSICSDTNFTDGGGNVAEP